jgi:endonuclease G, mitochondrial
MKSIEQIQANATARFDARAVIRNAKLAKAAVDGVAAVEDPQRLRFRESLINPNDGLALERIIGHSDLMPINYLEVGLRVAAAVCRVQVRDRNGRLLGPGTGFMVSPDLMLTNNHVIWNGSEQRRTLAEFNYEDDASFMPKPQKTFAIDPDRFFFTNEALDYTLVAVHPVSSDGTALATFGFLPLYATSGKALLTEPVSIIQHPDGAPKQIAIRDNRILDIFDDVVHYTTDTNPGSSGSPVLNDSWEVVALHHAGVKKLDEQGRQLALDGSVWTPEMGIDQQAWLANEGIRVSSILAHLRQALEAADASWTTEQRMLIHAVLEAPSLVASGGSVAASPTIRVETPEEAWYQAAGGYNPEFLGQPVPLPAIQPANLGDVTMLRDGSGHELRYRHFSVVMSKSRRLAMFTAVNIDGANAVSIVRSSDRWVLDPRIDEAAQSGEALYKSNDLDRGHLVRRLDPVWGPDAADANVDTFHFTNSAPQHLKLNRRTWVDLEDYVLQSASAHELKVCVFTGPVFRADDMLYRGEYRIPAEFWKVVVMVRTDGQLSATAYLQTQKNLIESLEFAYGEYRTYQVPVAQVEGITQLDFGRLRDHDPLAGIESAGGRVIGGAGDLKL